MSNYLTALLCLTLLGFSAFTVKIEANEQTLETISLADLARTSPSTIGASRTVEDFLFSELRNEGDDAVTGLPPRKSYWLEDPELRIEPSEDERSRSSQQYKVRLRPTSRRTREYQAKFDATSVSLLTLKNEALREESLLYRYQQLIKLAEMEVSLALGQGRTSLAEKMLEHVKTQSSASQRNLQDLRNASIALDKQRAELSHLQRKLGFLRKSTVGELYGVSDAEEPFLSPLLIDPARIEQWLLTKEFGPEAIARATRLSRTRVGVAENELALEKANSAFGLEFLEFSYSNDQTDAYSMTFGFRLPFARSSQSLREKARAVSEEHERRNQSNWRIRENLVSLTGLILGNAKGYDDAHQTLARIRREVSETSTVSSFGTLRKYELDMLERIAQLHVAVLNGWLDALHALGELGASNENVLAGGDRDDR